MVSPAFSILTGLLIASLNYFIKYILKLESSAMILGMSGYLLVSILSIPLWIKVAIKVNNNKKMIVLGSLFMGIATMVLFFANSIIAMLIIGCFVGLTGGVFFVMQDAINADVLDEMTLLDGERLEGTYLGVKFFFGRMANVVQFLILVLIHAFTNFVPEVINQSDLALLGIRLHISIIPGIAIIIGVLIFWKFYDLTPERMKEIKEKIIQQKL
ncbi:MAG: MFS transporter [Promethearchaeota archaeon]